MTKLTIQRTRKHDFKRAYIHLPNNTKFCLLRKLTKKELIFAILKSRAEQEGYFFMEGVLEIIQSEGYGFLRPINYSPSSEDIYISASQIRRFDLRNGDKVTGKVRPPKETERYYGLTTRGSSKWRRPRNCTRTCPFPSTYTALSGSSY